MVEDASELTVLQLPKFKAEATELIGADGIEAVAVYLIDHSGAGGARIIYLYVVITDAATSSSVMRRMSEQI